MRQNNPIFSQGFSLLETSLMILIIGLLSLLPIALVDRYQAQQEQHSLVRFKAFMDMAKAYALEHWALVRICPTQNNQTCELNWQYPLMAYEVETKKIIGRFQALSTQDTLDYKHFESTPWFEFHPKQSNLSTNGHWTYCMHLHCFRLSVNRAGHLKITAI